MIGVFLFVLFKHWACITFNTGVHRVWQIEFIPRWATEFLKKKGHKCMAILEPVNNVQVGLLYY